MNDSLGQLIEGFTLLDHAQLMASALFNGLHAFFKLQHFRIQYAVTLQQNFVFSTLIQRVLRLRLAGRGAWAATIGAAGAAS